VAVPVQTLGGPAHTLAADLHLRPLLLELGASTPTAAVTVLEAELATPEDAALAWARQVLPTLRGAVAGRAAGVPGQGAG
jgi:FMN reductase